MRALFRYWVTCIRQSLRGRRDLVCEIAAERQQLYVYKRQIKKPKLERGDRVFWTWLSRHWAQWKSALVIVKPETVLSWHREGFRRHWRGISKRGPGRPPIPRRHIKFIEQMSRENPEWGEDQIALELKLKLGVEHATSTIRKYMIDGGVPRRSTWRTFLSSHASEIFTMDFTTHYLWDYTVLYILVVMELERRRVVHVAVTSSPTLPWVKQQIREATPWGECPRFLLHDNDGIYGQRSRRPGEARRRGEKRYRCTLDQWLGEVMDIEGVPTPYGAPNAAAHIERFMGTLRRECLQSFIFVSDGHLRRTVASFARYYNRSRTHQGISGIPSVRANELRARYPIPANENSRLVSEPILGGLTNDYHLVA
jgi:putative transposase